VPRSLKIRHNGNGWYLSCGRHRLCGARQTPVGNTYTAGIEADTARFPQTVAWDTVQDYYGKAPEVARQLKN
jgi:hypothetical protein